jgi:hypothetical protein
MLLMCSPSFAILNDFAALFFKSAILLNNKTNSSVFLIPGEE